MATRTTTDRGPALGADADYRLGFRSLEDELDLDALPVEGRFPEWLDGSLIRNGPARFEVGETRVRHWFDGQAMLHRFGFAGGRVSYSNRFLRGRAFRDGERRGRLAYREFATDPCRSVFGRAMSLFVRGLTDNCNVNLMQLGERAIAMTETPMPLSFDPTTLEALGVAYDVPGDLTTAHPHFDLARREAVNYAIHLGPRSSYRVFGVDEAGSTRRIASVGVREPAYMHSFGLTERFAVMVEFPLVVNPVRLALSGPARRPFIRNYRWEPERGTRFLLVDREDGSLAHALEAPPVFAFHHVNAFERGGEVVVDLAGYDDATLIDSLYLDELRAGAPIASATLRRYRLAPASGSVDVETVSDAAIELPRIDYGRCNAGPYRYAYGSGISAGGAAAEGAGRDFLDQIVRIDVESGDSASWREPGTYPGEPVFVGAPDRGRADDEGVLLSVVLDPANERSFVVALDAGTLSEIARAEVPHPIPFGFHGQYEPGRAAPGRPAGVI